MGYKIYEEYRKTLICKICKTPAHRKNLCRSCYKRQQKQTFHCTYKSCTCPVFAATLCQKHYRTWRTTCLYCKKPVHCRHLCRSHYRKALQDQEFPEEPRCKYCDKNTYLNDMCIQHFKNQFKTCMFVDCENNSHKRGVCCKHYFRLRRRQ